MRTTLTILVSILIGCSSAKQDQPSIVLEKRIRILDSFSLRGHTAVLIETEENSGTNYTITCHWKGQKLLSYRHETPSASIRPQDLYGSNDKEIVVDDCVACEGLHSLRMFYFDSSRTAFLPVKGMDSISSTISKLPGTEYYFDKYAFNRHGEESTLFRLVGDSCIRLAKLFVPYNEELVEVTMFQPRRNSTRVLYPKKESGDSALASIWSKVIKKQ